MDCTIRQTPTLLVVDDEPCIREVMAMALSSGGYECVSAPNAREALTLFKMGGTAIDAVITDLHMPGMDGIVLARLLRNARPDLPILICSGSVSDEARQALDEIGVSAILPKPYTAADLLRVVDHMCAPHCAVA